MEDDKPRLKDNWPRGVFRGQVYVYDPEKKEIYFLNDKGEIDSGPQGLSIWLYSAGFVPTDKKEETWLHQGGKFLWASNPVKMGFNSPIPGIYKYENNAAVKNTENTDEIDENSTGIGKTIGYIAGGTALVGGLAYLLRRALRSPGTMLPSVGYPALPYKPKIDNEPVDVLIDVLHSAIDTNPKELRNLESSIRNWTDALVKTLNKEAVFNLKLCQDMDLILSSPIMQGAPYNMPPLDEFMELIIDHDVVSSGEVVTRFQKLLEISQFFTSTEAYSLENQIKKIIYDVFSVLNDYMMAGSGNGFILRHIYNQLSTIKTAINGADWGRAFDSLSEIYKTINPDDSDRYAKLVESVLDQDISEIMPAHVKEFKRATESYLSALSAEPKQMPKPPIKPSGFGTSVVIE
jgi:hypothetical protein